MHNVSKSDKFFIQIKSHSYEKVCNKHKNSVVLVRKRTIPTERPQPADEVSANFS
jgi:hypothetical protein